MCWRHYPTLKPEEIATLPLCNMVAKDAFLWLWISTSHLVIGAHIPIMRAWGFQTHRARPRMGEAQARVC